MKNLKKSSKVFNKLTLAVSDRSDLPSSACVFAATSLEVGSASSFPPETYSRGRGACGKSFAKRDVLSNLIASFNVAG